MDRSNMLTRVVLITAAITVAALGIALLVGLATSGFRWEQIGRTGATVVDQKRTEPLTGVDAIIVDAVSQNVHVVEAAGDSLEVWLHGSVTAGSPQNLPKLIVERSDAAVSVRLYPERTFGFGFNWSSIDLDLSIPRGYARKLSVKTVSGDVKVADHSYAELALSTTSGSVEVGTMAAPTFSMRTTSGTFRAAAVVAERSELSSVSGSIRIKALSGDVRARTTSGEVGIGLVEMPRSVDASSTSGEVTLELPANAQFLLDARSTSGDIKCRFPLTITQSQNAGGRHALSGAVGSSTGKVTVYTTSGDIRIE